MSRTSRSRTRMLAAVGMAAVVLGVAAVSFNASAAEVDAASRGIPVPTVPADLAPPAGSVPVGVFRVTTGTQTYTCVVPAGGTSGAFSGGSTPEARLAGAGGLIHHFAGPSWQSERDGSLVTAAKLKGTTPPPTDRIPELLLKVATHTGSGILTRADYINRLQTTGGLAPTGSCTSGQTVAVPYKAVYVFWDAPTGS
jgi:uncharacterized protein DUF3455